jgi:HTH-type transcriptional regulator/antitoxin MqsA
LGGGPRAFQKYESGADWVTKAMANLLRLLDRDPSGIAALASVTREVGADAASR